MAVTNLFELSVGWLRSGLTATPSIYAVAAGQLWLPFVVAIGLLPLLFTRRKRVSRPS